MSNDSTEVESERNNLLLNLHRTDDERLREFLKRLLDENSGYDASVQETTRRVLAEVAESNSTDSTTAADDCVRVDAYTVSDKTGETVTGEAVSVKRLHFAFFGRKIRRKEFLLGCLIFLSLVILGVILVTYYSLRDRLEVRDTPAPTPIFRNTTLIIEKLKTEFYESDLRNPESSQSKAMDWILNQTDVLPSFGGLLDLAHVVSFYFATGGDSWSVCSRFDDKCIGENKPWLRDTDYCNWYGVYNCDDSDRVTGFYFGTFPPSLHSISKQKYTSLLYTYFIHTYVVS